MNDSRRNHCMGIGAGIAVLAVVLLCFAPPAATGAGDDDGDDELIALVINLLGEEDKDLRALGLEQVRSAAKGAAATKRFAAQLPKLSPEAQVGLLGALADRADTAARPAVRAFLSARDESVKIAAARAIATLGEPADAEALMSLLSSDSAAVAAAARVSLGRLPGTSTSQAIAARMKQAGVPLRVTLIEILAVRNATHSADAILVFADHDDLSVRTAAMAALGQLGGSEHVAGMVRGILKAERGREQAAAEKAVMFVCARIADPARRADPLLAAVEKLDAGDRTTLLPTLGRVGGPAARKIVEAAIADSDPQRHGAGLRALCHWPDASVAARLIELAASDEHPDHRTTALRALIRVAPLPDERPPRQKLQLLERAMTMCRRSEERRLVLDRARAIRIPETLRFVVPYIDQPALAEQACLTVVELAHHRTLREPNKVEFHRALDRVIQISKDATVVDRAGRYKKGQTWVRPKK